MNTNIKTYSEMVKLKTFEERYEYLKLNNKVGESTFGFDRYLNQTFYKSPEWKAVRQKIILRDNGCDLGIPGREIEGTITIHHLNPITDEDIINRDPKLFDPENLICTVDRTTHKAIHFGDKDLLILDPIDRKPNDTCPWR